MSYLTLQEAALEANLALVKNDLVMLTWGNVSARDIQQGVMAIKPSGVSYATMKIADMVVLEIATGNVVQGAYKPSSDTPTHLALYRQFPEMGGIVHTHSHYATVWAQAGQSIPCFGTTHADYFKGHVLCTRMMSREEVLDAYEANTGQVIIETLMQNQLNWQDAYAILVSGHAPFTWGKDAASAVENAYVLEEVAKMALETRQLQPNIQAIPDYLLSKHYNRKHGPQAYYGQNDG